MTMYDILTRVDHSYPRFYSACYNQGVVKNKHVYNMYRTVLFEEKSVDEIIKFVNDNST